MNDKFQGYSKFFEPPTNPLSSSSSSGILQTKKLAETSLEDAYKQGGFSSYQKKDEVGRTSVGVSLKVSSGLDSIHRNLKNLVNSGRKGSVS